MVNCNLNDDGAKCVADVIASHPNLNSFNLSYNGFDEKAAYFFAKALNSSRSKLQNLDLSKNPFKDEGMKLIGGALRKNRHLKSLNINETEFIYEGMVALIDSMNYNHSLLKL